MFVENKWQVKHVGIWKNFPVIIQSIFSQNVVAVIFVISFVLNLILPQNMDD